MTVETPENTPKDAQLFVAGDFNAWHASSPKFKLESNGDGRFHLNMTVDTPEGSATIATIVMIGRRIAKSEMNMAGSS